MTSHDARRLDTIAVSVEPLALPIDDAAVAAGVTRTRIYEAISKQELTARKPGRGTIIEVPELRRWIQSLPIRGRHQEMSAD